MANKVEIATALIGDYCGDLRRAGFSKEDIIKALRNGVGALEQLEEPDFVKGIEAVMDKMGFTKVEEGVFGTRFDRNGIPQCDCAKCTARRRGADHQDEVI